MKSRKKIIGLVALLAGVVLFIFAKYEQHRVTGAKETYGRGASMFSGNAAGDAVGGYMQGRAEPIRHTAEDMRDRWNYPHRSGCWRSLFCTQKEITRSKFNVNLGCYFSRNCYCCFDVWL